MPTKQAKSDLKDARADIKKKFGDGAVMLLGEEEPVPVEVIPTGIMSLDYNIRHPDLGRGVLSGGIPKGRVTELFGPEGGGKSTLLLRIIAQANRISKRYCALIDSEHTFDPVYASKLGVDVDNLIVSQPSCGEEALDIADTLIRSNSIDVIGIDSAAMLTPRVEIEGEVGDAHVGARARLVTQALGKFIVTIGKNDVAAIFVNQLRETIGFSGYGEGTNTPCGRSLRHNSSLRIDVRRIGMLKISDKIVGGRVRFRIAKNKMDAPFRDTTADMIFGHGFSAEGDLIDFAVEKGVMTKSGASFEFLNGERFIHGREAFRALLMENQELAGKIAQAVKEKIERLPAKQASSGT